ncbi:NAD(+)/NADH kinase [bacterium]|nr:NAD(+)/NADH kinase [bacterium]
MPIILGITGNIQKDGLWAPVDALIKELRSIHNKFVLHPALSAGLLERGFTVYPSDSAPSTSSFFEQSELIISFGGDGTLLNTVNELGSRPTPILGVNHGRLGFLAQIEGSDLEARVGQLKSGDFLVDERVVLEASLVSEEPLVAKFALNEFAIQRSGDTGLLAFEVKVDGQHLNTYWADGLLVSTPTGSTAYSLALGGPIMAPGCGSILIAPIAPHTLTVRPIVIPDSAKIEIRLINGLKSHVFTTDGVSHPNALTNGAVVIRKAKHKVKLVRFSDQDYFSTLRTKLMWGVHRSKVED